MGGWEIVGGEEQDSLNRVFMENSGVAFAHGFDGVRKRYFVREAEQALCRTLHSQYCQMVSSGSAGLYCALKALGVGPGDEVITSAFTFIATIEAILLTGATPVPVDIDASFCIDPFQIEEALTDRTKVILPVHMAGAPAAMTQIMKIARSYPNIFVVEDACQAIGAKHFEGFCGTIGDIGVFSFDGGKAIQCGEGGAVVTNNQELYKKIRMVHDHGHDYSMPNRAAETPKLVGFNFRMTELQAAYLIPQIQKLGFIIACQQANKMLLNEVKESRAFNSPGEAGDSLILTFDSKEDASKVVQLFREKSIPIKNIPDALNWHFAGYWKHIFPENKWLVTEDLLLRSVCIGIPVVNSSMVLLSQNDLSAIQEELSW